MKNSHNAEKFVVTLEAKRSAVKPGYPGLEFGIHGASLRFESYYKQTCMT